MNWFAQHRQDWIENMLDVYGFINRFHLMRQFGVSRCQASKDLARFLRDNSDTLEYDRSEKCYRRPIVLLVGGRDA